MWEWTKNFWNNDWLTITLNKKTLVVLLGIGFTVWLYRYAWNQGANAAFNWMMQQQSSQQQSYE